MVKNEIEILPMFYRYIKEWADSWVVEDQASTDGTLEFLERMKAKGEMDIDIKVVDCDDFNGDFYKEYNGVIARANRKWIYTGHVDEFCPTMKNIIPRLLKREVIYGFMRYEICSLNPLLALTRETFLRLWLKDWNLKFKEGEWIHKEILVDMGRPSVVIDVPYYHIGRCRNVAHIQAKERVYEKCAGKTILTSSYDELARKLDRQKSYPVKDNGLLDMIL